MLRPRVQQLPPRPAPARTSVRANAEVPADAEEQAKSAEPPQHPASSLGFRKVLCAGLFGVKGSDAAAFRRPIVLALETPEE